MTALARVLVPLALLGLATSVAAAPAVTKPRPKASATCTRPDEAQCLVPGYVETACGKTFASVCGPVIVEGIKSNKARSTATPAKVLGIGRSDLPGDLRSGKRYPYKGPKAGRALAVTAGHAIGQLGLSFAPGGATTPQDAAKFHRRPKWETNGKVESCAEYAYEKLYDWSRFIDATRGCRGDENCEVDVAFLSGGTPAIARRPLRDKLGRMISPPITYVHGAAQTKPFIKNDLFAVGKRFVFSGGPQGVASTPELEALATTLEEGKRYYKFDCNKRGKGQRCTGPKLFSDEWTFHDEMHEHTRSLGHDELAEYERRRARMRLLLSLHGAAVAREFEGIRTPAAETAPKPQFDRIIADPFERYRVLEEIATSGRTAAVKRKAQLGPAALAKMPGAGIESIPVKSLQQQGALMPTIYGAGMAPQVRPDKLTRPDECSALTFAKAKVEISEAMGYGPISCRIGEMLREEWDRKSRGQKSCLDLGNAECDWAPSMFRARFGTNEAYTVKAQELMTECMLWTDDKLVGKADIDAVATYIDGVRKASAAALKELQPYRQTGGKAGKKFGKTLEDAGYAGDKDWFAGGYDYALGWSIEPIEATKQGKICQLLGKFSASVGVDAWVLKKEVSVIDALGQGELNALDPKTKQRSFHVLSHLRVLGKDLYSAVDEYYAMSFSGDANHAWDGGGARPLLSLPSPKPSWTVFVGPVPITGSAWGSLNLGAFFKLSGVLESETCSATDVTFGARSSVTPYVGVDGNAQVGVGISGLASVGIRAGLNLLTLKLPTSVDLLLQAKDVAGQVQAVLRFHADMGLVLGTLAGFVSLYIEVIGISEEYELFAWSGVTATIPLAKLDAELPLTGMK